MDGEEQTAMTETAYRRMVRQLFLRAIADDQDALERLVDLATGERVARWALQVVLELRPKAAARRGGLPTPDL